MTQVAPVLTEGFILLVEDQDRTRAWLTAMLTSGFPSYRIIAHGTRAEAVEWLAMLRPGTDPMYMALVDIGLPDGSGIDIIRQIAVEWPDAIVAVATIYDDDRHLMTAIAAGARGYLLKGDPPDILAGCLQRLARGEPATSPAIALRILAHFRDAAERHMGADDRPHQQSLSPRETEVLDLLARGLTVAEAAARLALSTQTVSSYVRTIYSKLGVSNRAQAVVEARRRGLG